MTTLLDEIRAKGEPKQAAPQSVGGDDDLLADIRAKAGGSQPSEGRTAPWGKTYGADSCVTYVKDYLKHNYGKSVSNLRSLKAVGPEYIRPGAVLELSPIGEYTVPHWAVVNPDGKTVSEFQSNKKNGKSYPIGIKNSRTVSELSGRIKAVRVIPAADVQKQPAKPLTQEQQWQGGWQFSEPQVDTRTAVAGGMGYSGGPGGGQRPPTLAKGKPSVVRPNITQAPAAPIPQPVWKQPEMRITEPVAPEPKKRIIERVMDVNKAGIEWQRNAIKSAAEVVLGFAEFPVKAASTAIGYMNDPALFADNKKALAERQAFVEHVASKAGPAEGVVRRVLSLGTPMSGEELQQMIPQTVNAIIEGYRTAPEQLKTGEIAPLLTSIAMTAAPLAHGVKLLKGKPAVPRVGEAVRPAAEPPAVRPAVAPLADAPNALEAMARARNAAQAQYRADVRGLNPPVEQVGVKPKQKSAVSSDSPTSSTTALDLYDHPKASVVDILDMNRNLIDLTKLTYSELKTVLRQQATALDRAIDAGARRMQAEGQLAKLAKIMQEIRRRGNTNEFLDIDAVARKAHEALESDYAEILPEFQDQYIPEWRKKRMGVSAAETPAVEPPVEATPGRAKTPLPKVGEAGVAKAKEPWQITEYQFAEKPGSTIGLSDTSPERIANLESKGYTIKSRRSVDYGGFSRPELPDVGSPESPVTNYAGVPAYRKNGIWYTGGDGNWYRTTDPQTAGRNNAVQAIRDGVVPPAEVVRDLGPFMPSSAKTPTPAVAESRVAPWTEPQTPPMQGARMAETPKVAKEPWEMRWQEVKSEWQAYRASVPSAVAKAEAKYNAARLKVESERKSITRQLKSVNTRMSRLNPTGDVASIDTASRAILSGLQEKQAALVSRLRGLEMPSREQFVATELPKPDVPSGQYEHRAIVEAAAKEGKIGAGIQDYPDLAAKYASSPTPPVTPVEPQAARMAETPKVEVAKPASTVVTQARPTEYRVKIYEDDRGKFWIEPWGKSPKSGKWEKMFNRVSPEFMDEYFRAEGIDLSTLPKTEVVWDAPKKKYVPRAKPSVTPVEPPVAVKPTAEPVAPKAAAETGVAEQIRESYSIAGTDANRPYAKLLTDLGEIEARITQAVERSTARIEETLPSSEANRAIQQLHDQSGRLLARKVADRLDAALRVDKVDPWAVDDLARSHYPPTGEILVEKGRVRYDPGFKHATSTEIERFGKADVDKPGASYEMPTKPTPTPPTAAPKPVKAKPPTARAVSEGALKAASEAKAAKPSGGSSTTLGYRGTAEIALTRPQAARAKPGAPVKASDIVKDLDAAFAPIRTGRFRQRARGIFKVEPNVVRSAKANDLPVISHETGHALHKLLWPEARTPKGGLAARAFPREFWPELRELAYPKAKQKVVEGYAEYIRLWLTDHAAAVKRAPEFSKFFDAKLKQYPQVLKVMERARADIRRWAEQPAQARVRSTISRNEPDVKRAVDLDRIYALWVDELQPLIRAEQEITKGAKVKATDSPSLTAWANRGLSGKTEEWLLSGVKDAQGKTVGKSLRDTLAPVAREIDDFSDFAVARHALDVIDSGKPMPLPRMDYQAVVDAAPEQYVKVLGELVAYQDRLLNELVSSGMLSRESANLMRKKWPNHVPLYRVMDETVRKPGIGRGQANLQSPVKRLKGSGRDIIDPIESIVKDTQTFLNIAARNRVMVKLTDLAGKFEDAGRIVEVKIPPKMRPTSFTLDEILRGDEHLIGTEKAAASMAGLDLDQVRTIFRPSYVPSGKENIVTVYRKGMPELYQLDPELHAAVTAADTLSADILTKMLAAPASILRAGATLTPEFAIRNPIRDIPNAIINSEYGLKYWDIPRALFHVIGRTDMYHQWKSAGGAHASMVSLDRNYLQGAVRNVMRQSPTAKVIDFVSHPIDALRALSELTEETTRVAEFGKGTRWGKTTDPNRLIEAAIASRDITVDFSRAGTIGKKMNRITAFFNATIGGADKTARVFKQNPIRSTKRAVAYITAPTVALYMLNRNDPRYQERQEWEKDLFWFIPTPEGMPLVRIPKPFELGVIFGSLPERILRWADKQDPHAFDDYVRNAWDSFTPSVLPTALTPWLQVISNRTFTGSPIIPRREENMPPALQSGPDTSLVAQIVGQKLDYSPRQIDHLLRGYFGGLGRYATQGIDAVLERTGAVRPPPRVAKPLSGKPVIWALLANEMSSPVQVERMYRRLSVLETLDKKADAGIGRKLTAFETSELDKLKGQAKELSDLRKRERAVTEAKNQTELLAVIKKYDLPKLVGSIEEQKLAGILYLKELQKKVVAGQHTVKPAASSGRSRSRSGVGGIR